jgi:hypothetical protein
MSFLGRWTVRCAILASLISSGPLARAAEQSTVTPLPILPQPAPPPPGSRLSLDETPTKVPTWRWAITGAALAVGAAGLVWGVATFAGPGTSCDHAGGAACESVMGRTERGAERTAAGAVIALAATVDLLKLIDRSLHDTSLSVGPKGLAVGGRF